MDALADVRKLRHRKYVLEKVLPEVREMIQAKKDPMVAMTDALANGFIRKFLPQCLNVDPLEEELIPAQFRMRLRLDHSNLVKPAIPTVTGTDAEIDFSDSSFNDEPVPPAKKIKKIKNKYIINPTLFQFDESDITDVPVVHPPSDEDADINDVISMSRAQYEQDEELQLNQAIESSLQNTPIIVENDVEKELFEHALMASLATHVAQAPEQPPVTHNSAPVQQDPEDSFYVCFDLRIYGPDPSQPLYFMELPYYFNLEQMDLIKQKWNQRNPDTSQGQKTHQELEYLHNMATDLGNL